MPADAVGVFWNVVFSVDSGSGDDNLNPRCDDYFDESDLDINLAPGRHVVVTAT